MLKNLSDYLSLFSLIFFFFYGLRVLVWSFTNDKVNEEIMSRFELLNDYQNNEEE